MSTFKIIVLDYMVNENNVYVNGNICFDINGNAYLRYNLDILDQICQLYSSDVTKFSDTFKNNTNLLYQININNYDEPYFEKDEFKIINNLSNDKQINLMDIISTNNDKDKIEGNELDELDELYDLDDLDDLDDSNDLRDNDYFPENKKYIINNGAKETKIEENKENDIYVDDLEVEEFLFASNTETINIDDREFGDMKALYDTIVYDEHFSVCFKTCADSYVLYRLNIYYDGRIILRPFCGIDKHYRVGIDQKGELQLIKL